MKIVDVHIHQVIVPMKPGAVHSAGVQDNLCAPDPITGRSLPFWEFPKWLVELEADNGLTGVGEPRRGDLGPALQAYADRLIGRSLAELPLGGPLPRGPGEPYLIHEAFEMAWYDLVGKHLGVPVWHLLGGRRIDHVAVDAWMGRCTPQDTADRARAAAEAGFRGVKMKCAWGDPVVERVRAVRDVAPHFSIVLDANERFETVEQTVELARALAPLGASGSKRQRRGGATGSSRQGKAGLAGGRIILESPVPQARLDWYVELRRRLDLPVALHLSSTRELMAALRADAADCYNLIGPLADFATAGRLTQELGFDVWRGTGVDLGVRDMSSVHAAAAVGCRLPSDIIGHLLREDDLIAQPIRFEDGALIVPEAPGLGVELDRDALERYRPQQALRCGLRPGRAV